MAKIHIKGTIIPNDYQDVYDWIGFEGTSPKCVQQQIDDADGDDLTVVINSGGGSVFDGSEIYTMLKQEKNVTVEIVGLAASAASVIAMAGDKITMSPTSQMMIHRASVVGIGNKEDFEHLSDVLNNVDITIANAYMTKSDLSQKDLLKMMSKETWLTPQDALANGFIDEIMFAKGLKIAASNGDLLSDEIIMKIKSEIRQKEENEQRKTEVNARLNFLKIKGDANL